MRQICCVYGCHLGTKDGVSLHQFPQASEFVIVTEGSERLKCNRRKLWEIKLRMGKRIPKHALVCSSHFQSQDYFALPASGERHLRRLKKTAVPSSNLPNRSPRRIRRIPIKKGLRIIHLSQHCRNLTESLHSTEGEVMEEPMAGLVELQYVISDDESPLELLARAAELKKAEEPIQDTNTKQALGEPNKMMALRL